MSQHSAPPVTIAPADESTFDGLLALIAEYQRFYDREPDEKRNRQFFGELLGDDTHGLQLVAREGDCAVGFATLYWTRTSTRATVVALLNDLFVSPTHRGGRSDGVGDRLLQAAAHAASARGYSLLRWQTAPENVSAQSLYNRFIGAAEEPGSAAPWIEYSCPLPYARKP